MARLRWNRGLTFALGGVVGIAMSWVVAAGPFGISALRAQAGGSPGGHDGGTIAFTTGSTEATQHLYIVDTRAQSFAVYRVEPRDPKGAVKLEAARQYRWDLKLAEFNNQAPEVATIESMVAAPRK
jgi:hypothetical protein